MPFLKYGPKRVCWRSEGEVSTSTGDNGGFDGAGRSQRIDVGELGERAIGRGVGSATEVVASSDGVATVRRVQGVRRVGKNVVLDQNLSAVTGIYSKMDAAEVVVVNAEVACEH